MALATSRNLLLGGVATGWLVGLLGLAGIGPLRPGLLTIAGTVSIAVIVIESRRRDRRALV